jgi:hypothetical protein
MIFTASEWMQAIWSNADYHRMPRIRVPRKYPSIPKVENIGTNGKLHEDL